MAKKAELTIRNKNLEKKLEQLKTDFRSKELSSKNILEKLYQGLISIFGFSEVSIYLLDPVSLDLDMVYPPDAVWRLPDIEKQWLIKRTQDIQIRGTNAEYEELDYVYIEKRALQMFTDKKQLEEDIIKYEYLCSDGLYWMMITPEDVILGIIFIHDWKKKKPLTENESFKNYLPLVKDFIDEATQALDILSINRKIESLLSEKQKMKERIKKDEEDLQSRIMELGALYDTSIGMGHSIDYYQIVTFLQDAIYKVLGADLCAVFLLDIPPSNQMFLRINTPVSEKVVKAVQNHMLLAISPLIDRNIEKKDVSFATEENFDKNDLQPLNDYIKSFVNVPLIFKEEVLGLLNISSLRAHAFTKNELTFIHTIANQIAVNVGRLRMVKDLEKSKIGSMVESMKEGIIMFDANNHLETINPAACDMLSIDVNEDVSTEKLIKKFEELDLMSIYYDAIYKEDSILDQDVSYGDKYLSINVTPVFEKETHNRIGMVVVLRDVTEMQRINRIKGQRLDIISRVHLIISSISDLDNLLSVLMEFVLNVADAEMGSILLKHGKNFTTRVHSNFPDKIRREFKYTSGETFAEHVIREKEIVFIDNYCENEIVNQDTKVLVDYYLAIPIMAQNDLIGVVNIVKKHENDQIRELSLDDIQTLTTITSLSGTAIYNAMLFQETLKKQKMDQELKVAHEIQTKLLPQSLPHLKNLSFGAVSLPARAIGGDYYDFFELDSGNLGVLVADIVGKGVPAALFMVMVKSIMQTNIRHLDSPAKAMKKLNSILVSDPVFNKYVPIFYAIVNVKTMTFKYCNAGHEPGLMYKNKEFIKLDTDGFPLGAWDDAEFEEKELKLKDGDVISLFTDGVTEARNQEGVDYGIEKLKKVIKKYANGHGKAIIENIYKEIDEYTDGSPQHDDLTMVIIKVDYHLDLEEEEVPNKIKEIKVKSSKKYIAKIRAEVEKIAVGMGFSEEDVFNLKLAINEAQANVLEHAYQADENGDILFKFMIYNDKLVIIIKDFGTGMDTKAIKNEKHLDELEGSGLGVFLIKSLMDKVEYKRATKIGTELWLTKFLKKEGHNGNSKKSN